MDLFSQQWKGINELTGREEQLVPIDIFAAGFECDSVSTLNTNNKEGTHSEMRDCMKERRGKTGMTRDV